MDEVNPIRVMIVDDHDMVRVGLGVLLDAFPDFMLVGEAASGEEAVKLCADYQPDVVLMDLVMPGMDGVQTIGAIRAQYPHIQIIALTSFKEEDMVHSALQAGATGYLLKNVSIDELAHAVRGAYQGKTILAPEAAQALVRTAMRPPKPGHDLTDRELEVLALMVEGLNNRQIGESLTISYSTVKNHVSNILSKLGAASRSEAVAMAVQHQLVRTP